MSDAHLHAAIARELADPTAVLSNPTPPPLPFRKTVVDSLTVRDHFAACALQGLLAAHGGESEIELPDAKTAATWAVQYADALLAELAKLAA